MSQITQKGATGPLALQAGGSFQSSTDANLATLVGTRFDLSDGREVIFVGCGGTAIGSSGVLCQDSPLVANHQECVVSAYTAYSANGNVPASLTITLGATALLQNAYQGGFLIGTEGPGGGQTLRIASHNSGVTSGTQVVITLEDAPNAAFTTASVIALQPAHGSSVVISPTTLTNVLTGVSLYPLAANSYGFLTSKGISSCLSDASAPAVGASVSASTTTAGTIMALTGSSAIIGYSAIAAESAEFNQIFVNL